MRSHSQSSTLCEPLFHWHACIVDLVSPMATLSTSVSSTSLSPDWSTSAQLSPVTTQTRARGARSQRASDARPQHISSLCCELTSPHSAPFIIRVSGRDGDASSNRVVAQEQKRSTHKITTHGKRISANERASTAARAAKLSTSLTISIAARRVDPSGIRAEVQSA